jgi:DtxR family transcriptional regulator, Mn-dependent transcriptional regulator
VSDLIDTTEMYLRTIFELEEEGITPMRARIAERLSQSGPTVSQTVARMERDGLVVVTDDRSLALTDGGRETAMRVMRKHRIAECMLVDLLQVDWEDVHAEACRWEHVMSTAVELKILHALGNPTVSPFGNPIPGIEELLPGQAVQATGLSVPLSDVATEDVTRVIVRRIAEPIQTHGATMTRLRRVGAVPGASVKVHTAAGGVMIGSAGEYTELSLDDALHVLVQPGDSSES